MKTLAQYMKNLSMRQATAMLLIVCLLHLNVTTVWALEYNQTSPDNLNANVTVSDPAGTGTAESRTRCRPCSKTAFVQAFLGDYPPLPEPAFNSGLHPYASCMAC